MNAALWLGGSVFFTFAVAPAFFSGEIKLLESQGGLHPFYVGAIAQIVLERYFYLFYVCGAVAVVHQLAEWVYLGRALHRVTVSVLAGLILIGGLGGLWLQPKLKHLYFIRNGMTAQYARPAAPIPETERAQAAKSFRLWHGVSSSINLLGLAGLLFYFWRVTHPSDNLRVLGATKFRS